MIPSTAAVRLTHRVVLLPAALATLFPTAEAQNITRGGYIRYVPLRYPRLVRQTTETVELQLFGDAGSAGYADVSPRNGIDDRRDVVLSALAARFGPYLVRNTSALPMNWKKFRDGARTFPLHIDEWETASSPIALAHPSEIDMTASITRPARPEPRRAAPLSTPDADWVRIPSISPLSNILPNRWHYGLGVEIIPVHPRAPLTGASVGLQLKWAVYNHSLGLGDLTIPSELALTRDIAIHRQNLGRS